jgi:hypothetical protein
MRTLRLSGRRAYVHFRAISRRCHRGSVSGVAIVAISRTAARPTRYAGQPAAIVVSQAQPSGPKLAPQEPVFLDQVGDRLPLPALEPAGEHAWHHLQRRGVDHEVEPISSRV